MSPSPTPSALPPVPDSPTYSLASTNLPLPSNLNLPLPAPPPLLPHETLSKADLAASHTAYDTLLSTAKAYRIALTALSNTASAFAASLEACARLKEARSEPLQSGGSMVGSFTNSGSNNHQHHHLHDKQRSRCTADHLLSASGVHHLISNHQQILAECVYRSFEVPLLHELDHWRRSVEEEEVSYQQDAATLAKEIRRMEREGLKLHRQRKRDVQGMRRHLVGLTNKLDGLTSRHGQHARRLLRDSQETSVRIVEASAGLVKAEVDIFEAVGRKGWKGEGLDDLLERGQDLFVPVDDSSVALVSTNAVISGSGSNDGRGGGGGSGGGAGGALFSILPQKSILPEHGSPEGKGSGGGGDGGARRADSLLDDMDRYQSLAGAMGRRDGDGASVFSDRGGGGGGGRGNTAALDTTSLLNRPRGARPFSPPPPDLSRASRDPLSERVSERPRSASSDDRPRPSPWADDEDEEEDEHEDVQHAGDDTGWPARDERSKDHHGCPSGDHAHDDHGDDNGVDNEQPDDELRRGRARASSRVVSRPSGCAE